ncbi:MAG TPA: hypothetical protein VEH47_05695 [Candidatus Acidoferrales bacterium]|nr:hypothetical protein [Candidatus Acidoferrales bacterium]
MPHITMRTSTLSLGSLLLCTAVGFGQAASSPATVSAAAQYSVQGLGAAQQGVPVSYASVTELNGMLQQLEETSKSTQADLVNVRIERWKTDTSYKKQTLANVDSIQRNLQGALPQIMGQLRAAPEDLPATFKLYRNLDALYDVLGSVVESAGAFGSKDEYQTLSNDLTGFENTRKQMAQRIENLSISKEAEIVRLRGDLKMAQAAVPVTPPKKIVVDDTAPAAPKKPAVKKKPATKPSTTTTTTAKPAAGQTQTPPAQPTTTPAKPQ